MPKDKERFGFLGIKGPKEKVSGGRRKGETRKDWKERLRVEAQLGQVAKKEGLSKKDLVKKDKPARQTTVRTAQGSQTVQIPRDSQIMMAVSENEGDIVGLASDMTAIEARISVLEAVEEEADETIGILSGGLGSIIGILHPFIATINAADVPVVPLAAQAAAFINATSNSMDEGSILGLGKDAAKTLGMLLTIWAYYDQAVGITSLFQTDAGGLLAGTTAAVPAAAIALPEPVLL